MNIIPEGDIYRLIVSSKLPTAQKFEQWVFDEVIPSVRQYGLYATERLLDNPDLLIEALEQLKAARAVGARLLEEKETLEIALNESLRFYTVAKYNRVFNMGWGLKKCQAIGKAIAALCRGNSFEIRKCETNDERFGVVNSYPLTAWELFISDKKRGAV